MTGFNLADGLGLLIGIVAIASLADRLRIAYPILLTIAGVVIGLLPIHHRVELEPSLFLLVFLPPLIYDASLDTSARDLRTHWRPILFLAVGLVVATTVGVAIVAHALVPQMGWAVAFTLGAVVSPPDSVAATQIAGKLGLPRRLVTILGGEGLMNDATALTGYQVAVAAVATTFTAVHALGTFVFAIVVGVAIGVAVGWAGSHILKFSETPVVQNTMLLILPFAAYLPADEIGASGVLAVVAAGLYFGRHGTGSLTAASRLQQRQIWDLIVFLLTGMSFLLVGLELRPILDGLTGRESASLVEESLAVVAVVIGGRMAWMFLFSVVPARVGWRRRDPSRASTWREATVVGWAGMRGAVSLAAALALPQDFPQRDLIVFLTFAVIVATLVGQGLTLPLLIRRLGLVSRDEQDTVLLAEARRRLTVVALQRLDELEEAERFPDEVVARVRAGYEAQLARIERRLESVTAGDDEASDPDSGPGLAADRTADLAAERQARRLVLAAERAELDHLLARRKVTEHIAGAARAALDVDETTMRP